MFRRSSCLPLLLIGLFGAQSCGCDDLIMVRDRDALCGNGELDGTESCDDGNDIPTDGCTDGCKPARCGDGITRQDVNRDDPVFEQCDDGNDQDLDGCRRNCRIAVCGDGVQRLDLSEGEPGYEQCDDGNNVTNDGCNPDCRVGPLPPAQMRLQARTGMTQTGTQEGQLRSRMGESSLPAVESERFKLRGGIRRAAP